MHGHVTRSRHTHEFQDTSLMVKVHLRKGSVDVSVDDDLGRDAQCSLAKLSHESPTHAYHTRGAASHVHNSDVVRIGEFRVGEIPRKRDVLLSKQADGDAITDGRVKKCRDLRRCEVLRALLKSVALCHIRSAKMNMIRTPLP